MLKRLLLVLRSVDIELGLLETFDNVKWVQLV